MTAARTLPSQAYETILLKAACAPLLPRELKEQWAQRWGLFDLSPADPDLRDVSQTGPYLIEFLDTLLRPGLGSHR